MEQTTENKLELELFRQALSDGHTIADATPEDIHRMADAILCAPMNHRIKRDSVPSRYSWWNVALMVPLCFAVVTGIWYVSGNKGTNNTKIYATANGQRASLALSSGVQVTLAPATTLRVQNGIVELKGQAVFTVQHDNASPFIVKTPGATVRVLGTTFAVRAYDTNTTVAVAEGRVSVASAVLSSGDMANVVNGAVQASRDTSVARFFSWTQGHLDFNDIAVRDLFVEVERWYGLHLTTEDRSLLDKRVSIMLESESQQHVVTLISDLLNATSIQSNGKIVLRKNP